MSLPITDAVSLIDLELEHRSRQTRRAKADLDAAIEQARIGNVRPYVQIQWPTAVLDDWQWDILESLFDPSIRRVFVKGNTGCGKGASAGIACVMYYHVWDDAKIIITRDSAETACKVAFGEVEKWWKSMRYKPPGALLAQGVYEHKQHNVTIANPQHPEGFRGFHSPHVFFWFDEATAPNLVDKYKLATTQCKILLATSNPSTLSGPFRDAFPRQEPDKTQTVIDQYGKTRCFTISGWDCTNVKQKCLEHPIAPIDGIEINGRKYEHGEAIEAADFALCEPIVPGQTCYDEFMSLLNDPDPLVRNVYALGRFPDEDPQKQLILGSWLDRPIEFGKRIKRIFADHVDVLNELFPIEAGGLDVAASKHGDSSVLALGGSYGIRAIHECQFRDTVQTMDWVLETFAGYGIDLAKSRIPLGIDWGGGYGNAVGDPLKRMRVNVIEIHGNATSDIDPKKYANKRAELYGEWGRRLDPAGDFRMMHMMIPDNPRLREELVAPQKIYSGHDGEKFYITPKDRKGASDNFKGKTLRELLGRSPDRADAVVYCNCALTSNKKRRLIVA